MSVLDNVFEVFQSVGGFFPAFVQDITGMFYSVEADGSGTLTFFGVLALCGLAFSIVFLVIGLISNFLHFRG